VDGSPVWLQILRDLSIVLLAIETIVVIAIAGVLLFVILKFTRLARTHFDRLATTGQDILGTVKDTTVTAAETVKSTTSTVGYASDKTVRPIIELYAAISGARRFVRAFFSPHRDAGGDGTDRRE